MGYVDPRVDRDLQLYAAELGQLVTDDLISKLANDLPYACREAFMDNKQLAWTTVQIINKSPLRLCQQNGDVVVYNSDFQNPNNLHKLTLYHGTPDPNFKPDPDYDNPVTDYGKGLYLTPYLDLAKEWASSTGSKNGYVYSFELDTTELMIFDFDCASPLVWLAELYYHYKRFLLSNPDVVTYVINKYRVYDIDRYDVITGWRGDGTYYDILDMFAKGTLSVNQINSALRLGDLNVQYCIKSAKALDLLQFKECIDVNTEIYGSRYINRMSGVTDILDKLEHNCNHDLTLVKFCKEDNDENSTKA